MPYDRKFYESAREEYNVLCTYDAEFVANLNGWIRGLIRDAEARDYSTSLDAAEIIGEVFGESPTGGSPLYDNLRRFVRAPMREKALAILTTLRKRCPPWQYRAARNWFTMLGNIPIEIEVIYEIDHPKGQVVFVSVEIAGYGNADSA